jgi:hypothetical protein
VTSHTAGLLEGAIDLHLHSAPDVDPRRYDDLELAREAARAGLRAILIKNHHSSTVERACLASKVVPEIRVFGGVALNETVGGLNPAAVHLALRWGARQVWMPTRSAQNHRARQGQPGGLTVLNSSGQLRPEVEEILRLMAQGDAVLATGHLSPEEGAILVHRARELGVKRILVTHPEWPLTPYPLALQKELARRGVMFERCFVSTTHRGGYVPMESIAEAIAEVGVETTVLSTDSGQPDTPPPVECLRLYAERLRALGFTPDQLRQMMCLNPARLLGL